MVGQSRLLLLEWLAVKIAACWMLGLAALVFGALARADDVRALQDGVALRVGGDQVELRVASPHAFLLHVFAPDTPVPARSIFLQPGVLPAEPFTITHDGAIVGIETAFGELRLDPAHEKWSLRDASGVTLVDWSTWTIGDFKTAPDHLGVSEVHCAPAPGAAGPPRYYGSGSAPNRGSLLQTQSPAQTGNGFTSLPQYWSSAGYGALMITASDDHPGQWKLNGGDIDWTVRGPDLSLYLVPAATLADWLRAQAELTGFAPVPPRWSLGYLQSRWGWRDKAYIDDTLGRFRRDQLPVDAFIIDFEWYTKTPDYTLPVAGSAGFRDFDWNPALFPDPAALLADFARNGLHLVGIRKPRLGDAANLVLARSKGWILPSDDQGSTAQRNLDFSNPAVRAWYGDNLRKFDEAGMAGFWNDEGELRFSEYSYWNLAEWTLLEQVKPEARFWSLNRAFAPGLQRFGAAVWTGDIASDWPTLARTPGELLAYGLSGMPYSTCDIGGFLGEPTPELMTRWMQAGVFFPIMRSHSSLDRTPRFPWLYGAEAEDVIRQALDLRYRLLPYYYSLAHENSRTALPLMRPLVMEFPDDAKVFDKTDEWLMGGGLLAAPLLQEGGRRSVYLPADRWFDFGTTVARQGPATIEVTAKLNEIPVFIRAGTILPLGSAIQDTAEISHAPLEVQIYPGRDATFDLVEDDGQTLAYQKSDVRVTHFAWDDHARTLSWHAHGPYDGPNRFRALRAVLFAPEGKATKQAPLGPTGLIKFPGNPGFD